MNTTATKLLVALLMVGAVLAAPASVAAQETETPAESNETVAPGERLAGVVGVGDAELDGEVQERAYGIQIAQANTDEAKADVVSDRLGDVEQRLQNLEERKQDLDEARENGSMSEGEYRAKMAKVHAETRTAERMANTSNDTANGLPADLLSEKGIDADAIKTLQSRADELSGPETAEIARSIAGNGVGESPRAGQADQAGERGGQQGEQLPDDENETAASGDRNMTNDTQDGANASGAP